MLVPFSAQVTLPAGPDTDRIMGQAFGAVKAGGKLQLSLLEAVYLHRKGLITLTDARNKPLTAEQLDRRAAKLEENFFVREVVFSDLRKRGYVVKTALKYGADFRVYDRGVKPGDDHAKWIVYPVHERERYSWHEFSGKNRIAHSTQKRLLLGIVDDEGEVIYYEVRWIRP